MALTRKKERNPYEAREFRYTAIGPDGRRVKGTVRGTSTEAVAAKIESDGMLPLSVEESSGIGMNADLGEMLGGGKEKIVLSAAENAAFFRQMSEFLAAGLSLSSALTAMADEAPAKIRSICETLEGQVAGGIPLSEALETYPEAFDTVVRSYVSAGESAGTLIETTGRLAETLEKRYRLRMKIRSVTAYPKAVSIAISVLVFIMIWQMVPMYSSMYESFGSELPRATQILISISENLTPISGTVVFPDPFFVVDGLSPVSVVLRIATVAGLKVITDRMRARSGKSPKLLSTVAWWIAVGFVTVFVVDLQPNPTSAVWWGGIVGTAMVVRWVLSTDTEDVGRARAVDTIRFKIPIMGALTRLNAMFQWATTLGGTLGSGVPMSRALELSAASSGSTWHRAVAKDLQEKVASGVRLSEAMTEHRRLYPASVRAMISTGEDTGNLAGMLNNVSRTIESEIDAVTSGLAAKVEVALLIGMGVVVGGILVALYLPVLNLAGTIGGL